MGSHHRRAPACSWRTRHRWGWAGVALVMFAAGCGNGGSQPEVADPTTTAPSARPEFLATEVQVRAQDVKFPQTAFTATAGDVTIGYVNEGDIMHALQIETASAGIVAGWDRLELPDHGDFASATVRLTPGEYTLFCDVPGHRVAGMEADLTVTP